MTYVLSPHDVVSHCVVIIIQYVFSACVCLCVPYMFLSLSLSLCVIAVVAIAAVVAFFRLLYAYKYIFTIQCIHINSGDPSKCQTELRELGMA